MSTNLLRAAVVGLGLIGSEHARVYAEHPLAELAAVVDVDADRAAEIGGRYDVPVVEDGGDLAGAIDRADVDVVTVATPEDHHLEPTRTALAADCHVLLEKPIADSEADALEIGRLAAEAETELLVGYVCRFDPRYARLKEELAEFGDLLALHAARVSSNWGYFRRGADSRPEYYLGVHDIDMLRWYVDSEAAWVHAHGSDGLGDVETPAVVTAQVGFENGTVATLETNWARTQEYPSSLTQSIRVTGTEGYGELSFEAGGDEVRVATDDDGFAYGDQSTLRGERQDFLRREVDHFLDCARTGATPLVTWEDGLRSLEVAHAIADSVDAGERVEVERERP